MNIEYEVHGADVAAVRIRAVGDHLKDQIKKTLAEAIRAAHLEMRAYFMKHRRSGRTFASIKMGDIIYSPGGLGGGGHYEVELSVGEGIPYFNIFVEGSGEHGHLGTRIEAGLGNVRPKGRSDWHQRTGAEVMKLPPKGNYPIYHRVVAGQEAHDEWIQAVQETADEVIREGLDSLDI